MPEIRARDGLLDHATRPEGCRHFDCLYLRDARLDEKWRPSRAKLFAAMDAERIAIFVDPTSPMAWRRETFYSRLKQWSKDGIARKIKVLVVIDKRTFAVLPDRDVDLGNLAKDDRILYSQTGDRLDVIVVDNDDARLKGGAPGVPLVVLRQ